MLFLLLLLIPTGIPPNEANAEIETQPVRAKVKISKFSTLSKVLHTKPLHSTFSKR